MPKVLVSADHQVFIHFIHALSTKVELQQCITWCNQVVKSVTSALFSLIDPATKQATLPQPQRMKLLREQFARYVQISCIVWLIAVQSIS
jgi:hypothetical protein